MANDKYIELVSNYLSGSSDNIGAWVSDSKGPFTSILSSTSDGVVAYNPKNRVGELISSVSASSGANGNLVAFSGKSAGGSGKLSTVSSLIDNYSSQGVESKVISDYISVASGEGRYVALYGVAPSRRGEWTYITGNQGSTLLYGPYVGGEIGSVVSLYGVPTPIMNGHYEPIVSLYGPYVPGPNKATSVTISITEEEIKQNISILRKSANTMENSWEEIKGPILKSIKESWIGKECNEYTSNIEKMNKKVTNSIEALRLLAKKYEESIDQLAVTRKSIMAAIDNL